ncbi:MAG: hypothetical protein MHMPM18_000092 [Marteilia pararefringens]
MSEETENNPQSHTLKKCYSTLVSPNALGISATVFLVIVAIIVIVLILRCSRSKKARDDDSLARPGPGSHAGSPRYQQR